MYDFSGIWFRIYGVAGIILLVGIVCILIEKTKFKWGYVAIAVALCMAIVYLMRIVSPSVSTYNGKFVESHRNSRVAPPLPVTNEYVFWDGANKKKVVYLDSYSKAQIYPHDFIPGACYTVYFDDLTNVIVKVIKSNEYPE